MIPPVSHLVWPTAAFVWGALWGSFLNVVIYRLPAGESVVRPASRCPTCRQPIPWYHNIPIVSWLVLRGRCSNKACRAPFSIRYALVEAAVGALSAAVWLKLAGPRAGAVPTLPDLAMAWLLLFAFVASLTAIALIDLDTFHIPDALSLPPIVLGLVCAGFYGHVTGVDLRESLLGLLIGGGVLFVITYGYRALAGRDGMGLGDYRLMAMVGAFLGWRSLLFLLIASAVQGLAFALLLRAAGGDRLTDPDAIADFGEAGAEPEPGPDGGSAAPEDPSSAEDGAEDRAGDGAEDAAPPTFRHLAIPFGPFIALAALEWLIFERDLMALFDRWVFHP